jgi:excinuclease ABC subunit A
MVPDDSLTIPERAIAAWPPAWGGQNQRDILVTLGYDIARPWRDLSKKDRDWILFTEEQPTVPVYAGFTPAETRQALKSQGSAQLQGTFTAVRRYVLHTFANTENAITRKRVPKYLISAGGLALSRQASASRVAFDSVCGPRHRRNIGHATKAVVRIITAKRGRVDVKKERGPPREGHCGAADRTGSGGPHCGDAGSRTWLPLDEMDHTDTFTGRELQRLRLATQVRSNLFGVIYVLDEPPLDCIPLIPKRCSPRLID